VGEEIAVQALHKGAVDLISKDCLSKDRLGGTIKAARETWKRKRAEFWKDESGKI